MGNTIPPEVFQEYLERQKADEARKSRMTTRRILAEMVRQEVTERALTSRRRKALVRFAVKYGIDEYEANLLVRAAEMGFGEKPDASDQQIAQQFLAELDPPGDSRNMLWMIAVATAANCAWLIWFLRK